MSNQRTVKEVARDVAKAWGKKVHYAARPYLQAMLSEDYGADGEQSVVMYFLANAGSFRGAEAKALKGELRVVAGVR